MTFADIRCYGARRTASLGFEDQAVRQRQPANDPRDGDEKFYRPLPNDQIAEVIYEPGHFTLLRAGCGQLSRFHRALDRLIADRE